MRPISEFPRPALARVEIVLTDIDDTLTDDGRLTAAAYAALEACSDAGFDRHPGDRPARGLVRPDRAHWPVVASSARTARSTSATTAAARG